MKRIFIAVRIADHKIHQKIQVEELRIKEELKGEKIKWVDDNLHHLTICFLGEIEDEKLSAISRQLSVIIKDMKPFDLKLAELGIFPNVRNPRVIWIGVKSRELKELGEKINVEMKKLGFKIEDREFSPHLTLGRIKFTSQNLSDKLNILMEEYKNYYFGEITVQSIDIMESILMQKGPEYKLCSKIELMREKN